jgi:hypothetical protein
MTNMKITLGVAAAGCLLASPAFAAKTSLGDGDLNMVTGKDNTYTFGSVATSTITNSQDASANIAFGWYQWTDDHSGDLSDHKGSNNQDGSATAVQQNVSATVNGLVWGAMGQNQLTNGGTVSLTGPETNMAYGVFAGGGF